MYPMSRFVALASLPVTCYVLYETNLYPVPLIRVRGRTKDLCTCSYNRGYTRHGYCFINVYTDKRGIANGPGLPGTVQNPSKAPALV